MTVYGCKHLLACYKDLRRFSGICFYLLIFIYTTFVCFTKAINRSLLFGSCLFVSVNCFSFSLAALLWPTAHPTITLVVIGEDLDFSGLAF